MAAVVPVAAAAAAPFSLTPGLSSGANVIDYGDATAQRQFKEACKSLNNKFDCGPADMVRFLRELQDRAQISGWMDILEVPPNLALPIETVLVTQAYGQISLQQVRDHAATYVTVQNRAAQDSMQLYICVMNSLTKEGYDLVKSHAVDYTVRGVESGVACLKVIIRESHIDTNSTSRHLRALLGSLDKYMGAVASDITKFNIHVKSLVERLAARGETTEDLIANLFKAYHVASDATFVTYISMKQDLYDEGHPTTAAAIMALAETKFKTLTESELWNHASEDGEKIIALEAQVQKLSAKVAQYKPGQPPKKGTPKMPAKRPPAPKKGKEKFKPRERPPWMTQAPKPGDPDKKTVNGKPFNWCTKHKAWGAHTSSACEGVGLNRGAPKQEAPKGPTLQLTKAYQALIDEASDAEE